MHRRRMSKAPIRSNKLILDMALPGSEWAMGLSDGSTAPFTIGLVDEIDIACLESISNQGQASSIAESSETPRRSRWNPYLVTLSWSWTRRPRPI